MKKPVMELVIVFKESPTLSELITLMDNLRTFMEKTPNILGIEQIVISFREEE